MTAISIGTVEAIRELNATMYVRAGHRKAFVEKTGAFWVVYSDPEKRERLGAGVSKKDAWLTAYRNLPRKP